MRSRIDFWVPAAARLFVGERDRLDSADQIGERRVHHQVFECVAVGRADQLNATFGNGPGGHGFEFGADFVDDDHLRHVIFDGFDHDGVLRGGSRNLHSAGASDGRVRNVSVAGNFVAGIDNDDALAEFVGEHAGAFPKQGRFAHAGRPSRSML